MAVTGPLWDADAPLRRSGCSPGARGGGTLYHCPGHRASTRISPPKRAIQPPEIRSTAAQVRVHHHPFYPVVILITTGRQVRFGLVPAG